MSVPKIIGREGRTRVCEGMAGIVVEKGINDASNMGAAMAPAALSTLCRYFSVGGRGVDEFDLIVTGDLGFEGGAILCEMMCAKGYDKRGRYTDCGMLI